MMPGVKRQLREADRSPSGGAPPVRKRRVENGHGETLLAECYDDLASDAQDVRSRAAVTLVTALTTGSVDHVQRVDRALTRLIKGVCSGRKAARLGFSIALAEVLRIAFRLAYDDGQADGLCLGALTERIVALTEPETKASGQEKRDCLHGRRFAFQAVLQSRVASATNLPDAEWRTFLDAVGALASHKAWLLGECGAVLWEYLDASDDARLSEQRVRTLIDSLRHAGLLKTPEGIALWLSVADRWPEALPKGIWHKKDPLSSDERQTLQKLLVGASAGEEARGSTSRSGARQSQPSFAWTVILSRLYKRGKEFKRVWADVVEHTMFAESSSSERKALGLQLVGTVILTAPPTLLHHALGKNFFRVLLNQRADPARYLFAATKAVLDHVVTRAKQEPQSASILLHELLMEGAFDQQTKTKTIESILQNVDVVALHTIVSTLRADATYPRAEDDQRANYRRRIVADILLNLVRGRRQASQLFDAGGHPSGLYSWLELLLSTLVDLGYRKPEQNVSPPISEASRSVFRARLVSCLGILMDQPAAQAVKASSYVVAALDASRRDSYKPLSKPARDIVKSAQATRKAMLKARPSDSVADAAIQAYAMLFDLSILQVYNEEPEAVDVLTDLESSYQARQEGGDSSAVLAELLLSFVSKPSALFRKLAEQVFSAFAGELTGDSLQSFLDILQQKESMSGQQELFEQHAGEDDADPSGGDEGDAIDVSDMSDVELVNGTVTGASEEDSDEGSSEDEEESDAAHEASDESEDDEVAAFNRKLAETLGPAAAVNDDSDDDGSDMDDDQMMAVDAQLATVFRERTKAASKKQENKDAKANIVNFKNRVLDLLSIYVKTQYANTLALDLILPLTTLVRTTNSKPTADKAFGVLKQYFDACAKHKSLPQIDDVDGLFELLGSVHDETRLGGSKLHAAACSRSSLYLSKVLVSRDEKHYEPIAIMYARLQSEWHRNAKSKVHRSIFTDWTSWSLATQRQDGEE